MKVSGRGAILVAGVCLAVVVGVRADGEAANPIPGQAWTATDPGGMEFVWLAALKCWVGKYEVTNAEYRAMKPDHDSKDFKGHTLNGDRQPVVYVNFDDANAFAAWLTQREQAAGRLPAGLKYRLPTKDEWTAFAQCGDNRTYPWGNDWPPKYGNYSDSASAWDNKIDGYTDGSAVTCPVERSGRNDWGLFGVGGNVWECTAGSPGGGFDAWRGASWFSLVRGILRCDCRSDDHARTAAATAGSGWFCRAEGRFTLCPLAPGFADPVRRHGSAKRGEKSARSAKGAGHRAGAGLGAGLGGPRLTGSAAARGQTT